MACRYFYIISNMKTIIININQFNQAVFLKLIMLEIIIFAHKKAVD